MKRNFLFGLLAGVATFVSGCGSGSEPTDYTRYVNPYIGTGGHGHVFLGANLPFGMVQLGPTQLPQGWDWCSGYNRADSTVIGFSHTHLSGTGIGDLADVTVMPVVGRPKFARGTASDPESGLWSFFSRDDERVAPGYYATHLLRYGIDVELTATLRTGLHRYTFPASDEAGIVIDLENGLGWDTPTDCLIEALDSMTLVGRRLSKGWARNQYLYFAIRVSKPFDRFECFRTKGYNAERGLEKDIVYGMLHYRTSEREQIQLQCAISAVSVEGALCNLDAEFADWDFEATRRAARDAWNRELGKVVLSGVCESDRRIFYTALYHTMIAPSLFQDVDGGYRGADGRVCRDTSHTVYTTFSLWDTYRAQHPLMTLLHPERVDDMVETMLDIFDRQGKLPVWHLMGSETNSMHGNPAICVISDAMLKGFEGFDHERAYEAMRASAMLDERGMAYLKEYGYIPYDKIREGLTKCMEYCIADGALARVAAKMGKVEDADYFLRRSQAYRRYYDPVSGFIRGLSSDSSWRTPFDPFESVHGMKDYSEGNAWQYTWLAPHDLDGLQTLFGGEEAFVRKLDELFAAQGALGSEASPDVTGLIGQYAHGNEPSHHIAYLYTYAHRPEKAADVLRRVYGEFYRDDPDGLCGNEDVGQMSAWYVLSTLGFYQVEPAGGRYYFGAPMFETAEIDLGNGARIRIEAPGVSEGKGYIRSVWFNGRPYDKSFIDYPDLVRGGVLRFEMDDQPGIWY